MNLETWEGGISAIARQTNLTIERNIEPIMREVSRLSQRITQAESRETASAQNLKVHINSCF